MRLEPGKVISGRYEIKEHLGSGGMAIVYRALDQKLDRSVTLKIMRNDLEEGFIERFYKEAQSVAGLSHANIVKVFDFGEDDGIHYIVMEYVDGATLKELIVRKAPFDEETILGVAVQIASGLLHAHQNDVVHRDIKPQNILVTNDGSVKIADFGIARAAKVTTLTSNANSMGSVHYFSPEQARGGFIDHKSDIYSLGITMFEMATGRYPYDGDAAVTIALKHINDPFPNPQEINPNISDHLCHIICKATEKQSTKRYAAIEDMYRDMKRTINNMDFLEPPNFESSHTVQISAADMESIRQHRRDYSEQLRMAYEDDEIAEDEGSNRKMMIAAFSTAAVLVLFITIASVIIYFNLRPNNVDPPDIVGLTVEQARSEVEPLELVLAVFGEDFSEEYEPGVIIHQSVLPGNPLRRGEVIHVTLSLGSAYFPMPNVIAFELDDVLYQLEELYLQVEVADYADATIPRGVVVSTEPEPGTMVTQYQTIRLYVSLGPENSPFPMVNLRGMNEILLGPDGDEISIVDWVQDELGLIVGTIDHQPNVMFLAGTVSWQSIPPDELVTIGQRIDLTISTGAVIPSPTPTPTPEPTDEEELPVTEAIPEPENIPSPEEPPALPETLEPIRSSLVINLWDVPEDTETVHIRVTERPEGGDWRMIVNYPVPVESFPLSLPIYGTGLVSYMIFSVDADGTEHIRAMEDRNFAELR